jgi:aminoglycoside phosphotransferase (APT) family kinase protein
MHDDEILVSDEVVRVLIASQFPEWSLAPILRISSGGTVNAIFRIGEKFSARFPLRPGDPESIRRALEEEALSSAEFIRCSPFPAPVHVAIGRPGLGYPLPWSVQTWLPGTVAIDTDSGASVAFALDLAVLVTALREAHTGGRKFSGSGRGGDLRDHDEWVEKCIRKSATMFDAHRLEEMWAHFRALPRTSPDVMSHRDLTPLNVLVDQGRLVGVLDCGGFGPADPAIDVIAGWHLLDDGPRSVFRSELNCDDLEWERSKAWAFVQALGALWYYVDSNPLMHTMGNLTLNRVIASH